MPSPRHLQVLVLLSMGYNSVAIAETLGISPDAVNNAVDRLRGVVLGVDPRKGQLQGLAVRDAAATYVRRKRYHIQKSLREADEAANGTGLVALPDEALRLLELSKRVGYLSYQVRPLRYADVDQLINLSEEVYGGDPRFVYDRIKVVELIDIYPDAINLAVDERQIIHGAISAFPISSKAAETLAERPPEGILSFPFAQASNQILTSSDVLSELQLRAHQSRACWYQDALITSEEAAEWRAVGLLIRDYRKRMAQRITQVGSIMGITIGDVDSGADEYYYFLESELIERGWETFESLWEYMDGDLRFLCRRARRTPSEFTTQ